MIRDTDSGPENLGPNPNCHLLAHFIIIIIIVIINNNNNNSNCKSNLKMTIIGQIIYHNVCWKIFRNEHKYKHRISNQARYSQNAT